MRSIPLARSVALVSTATTLFWLSAACGRSDAVSPETPLIPAGTVQASLASADMRSGGGGVSVTPKSIPEGSFAATIAVHVVNARPSTTYIVQRAPEVGRALGSDGVCQRALGLAPWSPADTPAAAFLSFVLPGETSPVSLTTSASGEGSVTFEFKAPMIPAGTRFDVMFRLLNDPSVPSSVFQSNCFTVTVL